MSKIYLIGTLVGLVGFIGVVHAQVGAESEIRVDTNTQVEIGSGGSVEASGSMEADVEVEGSASGDENTSDQGSQDNTQGEDAEENNEQRNETNVEFITRLQSGFSVKAVQVRGWDPEKKQTFLQSAKAQAQVKSEQDLESFAAGVLLKDANVRSVAVAQDSVAVEYTMPAKLFGFISSNLTAKTSVDAQSRVKVQYPWYKMFYRVSGEVQASKIQQDLTAKLQSNGKPNVQLDANVSARAEILAKVAAELQAKHETAVSGSVK